MAHAPAIDAGILASTRAAVARATIVPALLAGTHWLTDTCVVDAVVPGRALVAQPPATIVTAFLASTVRLTDTVINDAGILPSACSTTTAATIRSAFLTSAVWLARAFPVKAGILASTCAATAPAPIIAALLAGTHWLTALIVVAHFVLFAELLKLTESRTVFVVPDRNALAIGLTRFGTAVIVILALGRCGDYTDLLATVGGPECVACIVPDGAVVFHRVGGVFIHNIGCLCVVDDISCGCFCPTRGHEHHEHRHCHPHHRLHRFSPSVIEIVSHLDQKII